MTGSKFRVVACAEACAQLRLREGVVSPGARDSSILGPNQQPHPNPSDTGESRVVIPHWRLKPPGDRQPLASRMGAPRARPMDAYDDMAHVEDGVLSAHNHHSRSFARVPRFWHLPPSRIYWHCSTVAPSSEAGENVADEHHRDPADVPSRPPDVDRPLLWPRSR